MKTRSWAALVAIGLIASAVWFLWLRDPGPVSAEEVSRVASLDVETWETNVGTPTGWTVRYPPEWHLQTKEPTCGFGREVAVVNNVGTDLEHRTLDGSGCTQVWDMRELPANLVVVEFATQAEGPPPEAEYSQTTLPLSFDELMEGATFGRYGNPQMLRSPVLIGRQVYFVRVWLGPDARERDAEAARLVVESLDFAG